MENYGKTKKNDKVSLQKAAPGANYVLAPPHRPS